ncbi:hypothetical protein K504DRAFT_147919 [Pleomassaria siparia CBS 279.74]|uniref:Uncharacterized protein n=1 Tax=Pleomassaria siparia CBS 279.74 TaxID=1314801 RepID=A0A6G1KN68_9PLEO|nr:hypothetical protein K504DRAFT_147919 [Pleomassaria siparia CBS 279.74]
MMTRNNVRRPKRCLSSNRHQLRTHQSLCESRTISNIVISAVLGVSMARLCSRQATEAHSSAHSLPAASFHVPCESSKNRRGGGAGIEQTGQCEKS